MEIETENRKMAEGGSDDSVEKIVCGLCAEEYNQPKLLPCFHSYCLVCLETYVANNARDNAFDCPLCDTTIDVPEGGVNRFEWNIYLDRKLKYEGNELYDCDLCGPETNATHHCIDCEENYCVRCSEMHMKLKMSRMHTLISISASETGNLLAKTIKKKAFCTKHTKEEIKVVCKDCEKTLCLVCKLTDHEKHNSVDIEDEALYMKKKLKETIQKAENSVTKLDNILENLNEAKDQNNRNRDGVLEKLREHGDKLKQQIDRKISELETMINGQFTDTCSNIASLNTDTEKIRTSLTNLSVHATQIVSQSDLVPLVTTAGKVQDRLEQCISKAQNHKVENQNVNFSHWGKYFNMIKPFCLKNVSKIGECKYRQSHISNNVCSLSIVREYCVMSCTDTFQLSIVSVPGSNFDHPVNFDGNDRVLLCAAENKVFLSFTAKQKLKVWNKSNRTIVDLNKSTMYPHGIAHRLNNGGEELMVCFLRDDYALLCTKQGRGTVKVIPLDEKKPPYDFISETFPAPTRVTISKLNGLVCLSYPSVGRISVHAKYGLTIHCFDGKDLGIDQQTFRPFGVCFDNENCIIIADRDGGQVSLLGHVIQTLVKGNKPTAVGVAPDDKLWVGYEDKNVTAFQMTNKDE